MGRRPSKRLYVNFPRSQLNEDSYGQIVTNPSNPYVYENKSCRSSWPPVGSIATESSTMNLTKQAAGEILSHWLDTLEYPNQDRHKKPYSSLAGKNDDVLHGFLISSIRLEVLKHSCPLSYLHGPCRCSVPYPHMMRSSLSSMGNRT